MTTLSRTLRKAALLVAAALKLSSYPAAAAPAAAFRGQFDLDDSHLS